MAFADFDSAELPENIAIAFQRLYAQLRAFVSVSFKEDGTMIPAAPNVGIAPIGTIVEYAGATAPTKWLLCDGTAVSRVTYKDLFAVVGTAYGIGDGSTTFNVPDFRQRFALGKAAAGTGATLGNTGGVIDHTHTGGVITGNTGSTAVTISGATATGTTGLGGEHDHGAATGSTAPGTDTQGAHNHGGLTGGNADATPAQNGAGPPFLAPPNHFHAISSDGGHSHTVTGHTHTIGSAGSHAHSIPALGSGTLAGAGHTHNAGTFTVGVSGTQNPPFLVVNKIILAGV